MLQMTFVNCIAILSNYFGGEVKFVLVAKINKSLTRIFSEKISECFRINTNASKTWLKYRPDSNRALFQERFKAAERLLLLFYVHGKHLRSCRDGQLT